MTDLWKPKGWLSILYGLVMQPFAFLYVNKIKWFWCYLILGVFFSFLDSKLHGIPNNGAWYQHIYFSWLLLIICPLHAYIISRGYNRREIRSWYASWWGALICFLIFFVLLSFVRIFLYEPFTIPSKSMSPTLNPGDQLIVSKSGYGNYRYLGMQVIKKSPSRALHRGDVIVFQYPNNPQVEYVKRVVGLPGDTVIYRDKKLYIKPSCSSQAADCSQIKEIVQERKRTKKEGSDYVYYQASLGDVSYNIQLNAHFSDISSRYFNQIGTPPNVWVVPDKHYFMLGDNRDNSLDSRYWGFLPEANVIGKVTYIW